MFKKRSVDQSALDQIRKELILNEQLEHDYKTETGKRLIELIDNSIEDTIEKFAHENIEKYDSDTKIIIFFSACRSKLQTLLAFRKKYVDAEKTKMILKAELNEVLPKE